MRIRASQSLQLETVLGIDSASKFSLSCLARMLGSIAKWLSLDLRFKPIKCRISSNHRQRGFFWSTTYLARTGWQWLNVRTCKEPVCRLIAAHSSDSVPRNLLCGIYCARTRCLELR